MSKTATRPPKLQPAWFKHLFWRVHRTLNRVSGGRFLWTPASKRGWGALRLTTIGRKSGQQRSVIVGYIEDGPNLVVLAMNGWDEGHPSWWLNLEAHPDAIVRLPGQPEQPVHAVAVAGEERERLWQRWAEVDEGLDGYEGLRSIETPVVVLEPRDEPRDSTLQAERLMVGDADERALPIAISAVVRDHPNAAPGHVERLMRECYERTSGAPVQLYRAVLAERSTRAQLRLEQLERRGPPSAAQPSRPAPRGPMIVTLVPSS